MLRNNKWNFTILVSLVLLLLLAIYDAKFSGKFFKKNLSLYCNSCNVVVIDIDVLRHDAIDCKNAREVTPNICELEDKSIVFENNASQSDLTINSFLSFMTSLYPSSHQAWNLSYPTEIAGVDYLSSILERNGYNTLIAGDVLKNKQIVTTGFDDIVDKDVYTREKIPFEIINKMRESKKPSFIFYYIADLHFPYLMYTDRYINKYQSPEKNAASLDEFWELLTDYVADNYKDVFTQRAIDENPKFFENVEKNKHEIFQIYLQYSYQGLEQPYVKDVWGALEKAYFYKFGPVDSSGIAYMKENYLQSLHIVDSYIKPLIDNLLNSDLNNKTVVVLISNHGDEFFEHGSFSHQNDLYQELIHTPLMIMIPGVKPKKIVNLTQDIDVMPTLMELLNFKVPDQAEGKSMVGLMVNPSSNFRDYQIAQKGGNKYIEVFRKGDWKETIKRGEPVSLYNLAKDPGEKENIISENYDLAKDLHLQYNEIIDPLPKYNYSEPQLPEWVDEEKQQRLKDEGYF